MIKRFLLWDKGLYMQKDEKTLISAYLIERTAKILKHSFAKDLLEGGIPVTVDQWIVLRELDREDGLSQQELAAFTHKDAPTLTRILDLLESKNYINRIKSKIDRRRYLVIITPEGRKLVNTIWPLVYTFRSRSFGNIDLQDLIAMDKVLNTINDNLNSSENSTKVIENAETYINQ